MKLKSILITAVFASVALHSYAQQDYAADALLYSGSSLSGTARYQGIGGAQTALGADVGSISGNPAGLGFFKKSEWSISPALGYVGTSSQYIGNTTTDGKLSFTVPNLGLVFSSAKDEITPGKWRGGAFGISFSRQNSFQNRYSFDGVNNRSSIADRFVLDANNRGANVATLRGEYDGSNTGTTSSKYDGGATSMYYESFLANPFGSNGDQNNKYFQFEAENEPDGTPRTSVRQQKTFNTSGAQSQWNLAYGGNYADKLYFGAAVGIARLNYNYLNKYDESYINGKVLRGLTLNEDFSIRGTGINLNLGVIFRANDVVRLGANIVTPTFYSMTETYNSSIDIAPISSNSIPDLDDNGQQKVDNQGNSLYVDINQSQTVPTAPRTFNYNLSTPWRASAGAAFFLGKKGFISLDGEFIDYTSMKLKTSSDDPTFKTDYENGNTSLGIVGIKNQFKPVTNFRIGGEFRQSIFRFRGGFGYQMDPYKDSKNSNLDRTRLNFSLGAGVRLPNFYFDVAATHSQYKTANTPYTLPDNSSYASALIQNQFTNVVLTFGTFF